MRATIRAAVWKKNQTPSFGLSQHQRLRALLALLVENEEKLETDVRQFSQRASKTVAMRDRN
jgi:hypothetical protein